MVVFFKPAPAVVKDSSREQCYLTHRDKGYAGRGATTSQTFRWLKLTWAYTESSNNANNAGHADVAQDWQLHLRQMKSGVSLSWDGGGCSAGGMYETISIASVTQPRF